MYLYYTIYKNGHILNHIKEDVGNKDIKEILDYLIKIKTKMAKEYKFDWTRTKFGKSTDGYWVSYKYGNEDHEYYGEI